jgi:hypothetical protein
MIKRVYTGLFIGLSTASLAQSPYSKDVLHAAGNAAVGCMSFFDLLARCTQADVPQATSKLEAASKAAGLLGILLSHDAGDDDETIRTRHTRITHENQAKLGDNCQTIAVLIEKYKYCQGYMRDPVGYINGVASSLGEKPFSPP